MAEITVHATFNKGDNETETREETFFVTQGLKSDIDTWVEETLAELYGPNFVQDVEIIDYEDDFGDPYRFDDLDEYAEFVEKVEEHGEAYRLRYEDIGEFDFEDQYQGCYEDEADFAESISGELSDIPDWVRPHINWESVARDVMYDYSAYDGNEGCHIFRD